MAGNSSGRFILPRTAQRILSNELLIGFRRSKVIQRNVFNSAIDAQLLAAAEMN